MARLNVAEYAVLTGCAEERIVHFIKMGYLSGEEVEGVWRVEPNPLRLGLARVRHYHYRQRALQARDWVLRYRKTSVAVALCALGVVLNPNEMDHYSKARAVVSEAVTLENATEKGNNSLGIFNLLRDQLTDNVVMEDFAENTQHHHYGLVSTQTYRDQVISVGALGYVYLLPQFNVKNVRALIKKGKGEFKDELKSLLQ